jgi:hypothetical protein
MMFWFKKKKIVMDCFTYDEAAYNLYPIRKAMPYYPDTIKQMPLTVKTTDKVTNVEFPMPTMKLCTGISGLYKEGAIIPFWTDYLCQPKRCIVEKKSRLGLADGDANHAIVEHSRIQFPGMFEDFVNVKFHGIWHVREKTGVNVLLIPATYNLNNLNYNFIIPPSLSYYDLQTQTNIQMFVRADSPDFTIMAGTPMIHMIPITENEVEWKRHLVSREEWMAVQGKIPLSLPQLALNRNARYKKLMKEKEAMDAMEKPKCPFGFGR